MFLYINAPFLNYLEETDPSGTEESETETEGRRGKIRWGWGICGGDGIGCGEEEGEEDAGDIGDVGAVSRRSV